MTSASPAMRGRCTTTPKIISRQRRLRTSHYGSLAFPMAAVQCLSPWSDSLPDSLLHASADQREASSLERVSVPTESGSNAAQIRRQAPAVCFVWQRLVSAHARRPTDRLPRPVIGSEVQQRRSPAVSVRGPFSSIASAMFAAGARLDPSSGTSGIAFSIAARGRHYRA